METGKTALAARIYISMRREAKRSIDVEWLLKNTEYAREIIALAKQHSPELIELALHFEALFPAPPDTPAQAQPGTSQQFASAPPSAITDRYIGRLR